MERAEKFNNLIQENKDYGNLLLYAQERRTGGNP